MHLLADPVTLLLAALAVIVLGLATGGFSALGALATPLLALLLAVTATWAGLRLARQAVPKIRRRPRLAIQPVGGSCAAD